MVLLARRLSSALWKRSSPDPPTPDSVLSAASLLFVSTVTFLKLWSYVHTNWDYRQAYRRRANFDDNAKPPVTPLGEVAYPDSLTVGGCCQRLETRIISGRCCEWRAEGLALARCRQLA